MTKLYMNNYQNKDVPETMSKMTNGCMATCRMTTELLTIWQTQSAERQLPRTLPKDQLQSDNLPKNNSFNDNFPNKNSNK